MANDVEFTLILTWYTEDGNIECTLRNDFVDSGETRNIISCASDPDENGAVVLQLRWISEGYTGASRSSLPLNLLAFFQNVHGGGGVESTPVASQELLKNVFSNNFFSCCFPSQLDNAEYFGIVSGIGFLLEGVFTFLVALVVFKGRLPDPKLREASQKELAFSYSFRYGDEIKEGDGAEIESYVSDEASMESPKEALKRWSLKDEISGKSVHAVKREDLIRVVFNPRCRYIPYSSTVSFISLALLIAIRYYIQLSTYP